MMHMIISCEHATNFIPKEFKKYFKNNKSLLLSHRGLDINAEIIATRLYEHIKKKILAVSILLKLVVFY